MTDDRSPVGGSVVPPSAIGLLTGVYLLGGNVLHRYKTDDNCPRPTRDEERQSLGSRSLTIVGLLLLMLVAALLLAFLSTLSTAATSNVYWRVDLNQGSSIIAHGQGATEQAAWEDCFRLQVITRAMTAAETRKLAVAAVSTSVVRWCQNPKRYATVSKDPVSQVTLSWTPPTQNSDGSALTNLAGYRVSYGTSPTALVQTIQIAIPGASSYVISSLAPGTYYFAVRAYTSSGTESPNSSIGSKVLL